jgi:hypothetical protein
MKDYKTLYGSLVLGDWPNTTAKNASGPGASDGTPFTAEFVNDLWGSRENLLSRAGLTPNGVTEAVGGSQFVEALKRGAGLPVGLVLDSAKNPVDLALCRLLPLSGQIIDISPSSPYSELGAATYVGDANNGNPEIDGFYKCDEQGNRATTGGYMRLPRMDGLFRRATGSQTRTITWTDSQGGQHTVNTLYDGKDIGRFQGDRSRRLTGNLGNLYVSATSTTSGGGSFRNDNTSLFWNANTGRWSATSEPIQFDNNVKPVLDSMNQVPTGADNAPASISLQAVISY